MDVRCCSAVTGAGITVRLPLAATIDVLRRTIRGHLNDPNILADNQIRILLNDEQVAGSELAVDGQVE